MNFYIFVVFFKVYFYIFGVSQPTEIIIIFDAQITPSLGIPSSWLQCATDVHPVAFKFLDFFFFKIF